MRNADNDSNAYSYSHRNADGDGYIYPNTDRYVYPDSDRNCDAYYHRNASYSNTDTDSETFTDAEIRANAQAAWHAATAPITIYKKETHCSTPTSRREHAKDFGVSSCPPACSRRLSE